MIIKEREVKEQEKQGSIINAIGSTKDLKMIKQHKNGLEEFGIVSINNSNILDFETEYERLFANREIEQHFMIEVDLNNNAITKSYIETRDNDDVNVIHIQDLDVKYSEQEKKVIKTFVEEIFK